MNRATEQKIYEFDNFRLDVDHRMLYRDGNEIPMFPKAVETLLALIERRGEIASKEELLEVVWPDTVVEESNLFFYLSLLRKNLGTLKDGRPYVETLRRRGYRFNGDVQLLDADVKNEPAGHMVGNHKQPKVAIETARLNVPARRENASLTNLREVTLGTDSGFVSAHHEVGRWTRRAILRISLGVLIASLVTIAFYWHNFHGAATNAHKPKTIVVLPFRSAGSMAIDELGLRMADTLIDQLGKSHEVRPLRAVLTGLKFDRPDYDAEFDETQVGKDLGAECVLDGRLERSGDLIRLKLNLIRVADGAIIWSGLFDSQLTDTFQVQNEMATKITRVLEPEIEDETGRVTKRYTSNRDAYEAYYLGRHLNSRMTEEDLRKAIGYYGQAIAADPDYSLAYIGIADVNRMRAITGFAAAESACSAADKLATQASALDPTLSEPYVTLGSIDFLCKWDWRSAEKNLKHAIDLDPNNADAHSSYGLFLSSLGRHEEAVAQGRLASELSQAMSLTRTLESQFLLFADLKADSLRTIKTTLEIDPDFWVALNQLGRIYIDLQQYDRAIVELTKASRIAPESCEPPMQIGYALAVSDHREQALELLSNLQHRSKEHFVPFYSFAMIYNGLHEREKALEMLESAVDNRESQLIFILGDRRWDNLRSEPRFRNILRRMNLP